MQECEGHITTDECKAGLKTMKINSSSGSDGLTTSQYIVFCNIKGPEISNLML